MRPEIDLLIQEINDHPDKLHSDYTPSVYRLIEMGEPALAPVLDLMLAEHRETRMRAQRVIEGITMKLYGFETGHGWEKEEDSLAWQKLWQAMGNLDYDDPLEKRAASIGLWKEWNTRLSQSLRLDDGEQRTPD